MFEDVSPQEGSYLAGFVDGEGSFNLSFRRRGDYKMPWKISLCFNVSQREVSLLRLLQIRIGCGTLRQRSDGCWYFEVNSLENIAAKVIPFFERFPFLSEKKMRDFRKFKELASLLVQGRHLSKEGVLHILRIRSDMNDGGKRKYSDEMILQELENPQRLYAGLSI